MSFVNGVFTVACPHCGESFTFNADEADFDHSSTDDRQMGAEHIYTWEYEFECAKGHPIEVEYDVSEYPVGAYNFDEARVNGQVVDGGFTFNFQDEEQIDEEE